MILKQSKAKMCNGRRHVPLCPASANEKYIVQKCNYNTILCCNTIIAFSPKSEACSYYQMKTELSPGYYSALRLDPCKLCDRSVLLIKNMKKCAVRAVMHITLHCKLL